MKINKQITEDYCSFEISKLLKEKGFDEHCGTAYTTTEGYPIRIMGSTYSLEKNSDYDESHYSMPSQNLALKWLREVHNIHISVQPDYPTKTNYQLSWCWSVNMLHKDCFECKKHQSYIDTFEQAVEAALLYVLKNLI